MHPRYRNFERPSRCFKSFKKRMSINDDIIFQEGMSQKDQNKVWIMDSDGDRKERITPLHQWNTFLNRAYPRWSPSGKYIMYIEREFVNDPFKTIANRLIIQNVFTDRRTIHKFPIEGRFSGLAWMGNDETTLFVYREQTDAPRNIYRYNMGVASLYPTYNIGID